PPLHAREETIGHRQHDRHHDLSVKADSQCPLFPKGRFSMRSAMSDRRALPRIEPTPATGCVDCRVPCCRFLEVPLDEDEAGSGTYGFTRARAGVAVLVRDDRTGCVYLRDGRCSIYERRPRVCRTFDCTGDTRFELLK